MIARRTFVGLQPVQRHDQNLASVGAVVGPLDFTKVYVTMTLLAVSLILNIAALPTPFAQSKSTTFGLWQTCSASSSSSYWICSTLLLATYQTSCPNLFNLVSMGRAGGIIGCVSFVFAFSINLYKRCCVLTQNNNNCCNNQRGCNFKCVSGIGACFLVLNFMGCALAAGATIAIYKIPYCQSSASSFESIGYSIGPSGILFAICAFLSLVNLFVQCCMNEPVFPNGENNNYDPNNNNNFIMTTVPNNNNNNNNNNGNMFGFVSNNNSNNQSPAVVGMIVGGGNPNWQQNNNNNQQQQQQPPPHFGYYYGGESQPPLPPLYGSQPPPPPPLPGGIPNNDDGANYVYGVNNNPGFVGLQPASRNNNDFNNASRR